MSIDTCKACDAYIDTDHEPDCYVEVAPGKDICLCERCRELRQISIEDQQEAEAEARHG